MMKKSYFLLVLSILLSVSRVHAAPLVKIYGHDVDLAEVQAELIAIAEAADPGDLPLVGHLTLAKYIHPQLIEQLQTGEEMSRRVRARETHEVLHKAIDVEEYDKLVEALGETGLEALPYDMQVGILRYCSLSLLDALKPPIPEIGERSFSAVVAAATLLRATDIVSIVTGRASSVKVRAKVLSLVFGLGVSGLASTVGPGFLNWLTQNMPLQEATLVSGGLVLATVGTIAYLYYRGGRIAAHQYLRHSSWYAAAKVAFKNAYELAHQRSYEIPHIPIRTFYAISREFSCEKQFWIETLDPPKIDE